MYETWHTHDVLVALGLEVLTKTELSKREHDERSRSYRGTCLVLYRTEQTRLSFGGIVTFVQNGKNLQVNDQVRPWKAWVWVHLHGEYRWEME